MSLFGAVIRYSGPVPKHVTRGVINQILKEGYRLIGIYWQKHLLPKHFTHAGAREYGYTPRKGEAGSGRKFRGSYTFKKLQRQGHTKPLVYTGASEQAAKGGRVTSTSKGVRVTVPARALNFKPPRSNINMRQEVTRISDAEAETLTRLLGKFVERRLNQLPATSSKKV